MLNPKSIGIAIGALSVVLVGSAEAQGEISLQQAQAECQSIAQQQTGTNPTTGQPQAGGRARGAAAGAMAGAAKGKSKANQYDNVPDDVAEEYTKNQMKDAAKMGAAAGAARQRQQRRQGAAAQQQQQGSFDQAYASCMAAKGFPGQ